MSRGRWLFDDEDDGDDGPAVERQAGEDRRCDEETLLAFYRAHRAAHGKPPTLRDCKAKFGGILGPMVVGWRLRERGLI